MARRGTQTPPPPDFEENIVDVDVSEEMRGSYLEYAYSVIYQRALPDARDGLKPVQRRILYSMNEMGLRPDRGHVKCARVVGEVMGKLHPHGDSAIYDALVRLAQPWAMRMRLVDGHGNFGSLGGDDSPAAMRYTEARMSREAALMVASIDEETVDFRPNYDGQEQEPEVLPSAFPNLLVNGSSGIAVGMATNMAPHNLGEVIAAARHLIKNPEASLDDLMRFVPGPDLPTGGKIVGLEGVRDAYETGRGIFRTRATAHIESVTPRRKGIVVTELPYAVGPERVVAKIKDLVNAKKISGIADLKDLTDRQQGLRLVIEIKNGFHPEAVLEELYRLTPMEETFGINNVALVDGQPRTLGLRDLLQVYVDHRIDVVRRRSLFRRKKREDRLHLVDGLVIALLNIDEVIRVIRESEDSAEAKTRLMAAFELSEIQAQYILDTPLRRLTKYDRLELESEKERLTREIAELTAILESEAKLRALVSSELAEIAKTYGTPRRTVLLESSGQTKTAAVPLEVADDPCRVLLSSTGLLARTTSIEPLPAEGARAPHDVIVSIVGATARGQVGAVTSAGRMIRVDVLDLPALPPSAAPPSLAGGAPMSEFVTLEKDETVVGLASLDAPGLTIGTEQGVVKRVAPDYPKNADEFEVIGLKDGDRVVRALQLESEDHELVFITSDAQLLRFPASSVRPQGRAAGGMAGIRLSSGARVVWFGALDGELESRVVTIAGSSTALPGTQTGAIKVADYAEYPAKGRATGGVRAHRFLKGEDVLILAWAGPTPARASGMTGKPLDLPTELGRRDGSGVKLPSPITAIAGPVGTSDAPAQLTESAESAESAEEPE
ncbi:DNA gyrase/topoisomerase IV subunit A [Actinoallomurus iriomotensis]|uniref:DNA topoisomerase (ATP-hydrolyzing) n=1 Tax=Actinoallomurus iriomotensis TaxID=478107 RepID=A0A9W6W572_9ACTN|nr:DNA topoisomerase IV subunit A [Actinoallomurus iriomotensis]GLY89736.1 DNA topoisomerase (ATP-hydrolyzing) [Actinoallomurus iriomotensis]